MKSSSLIAEFQDSMLTMKDNLKTIANLLQTGNLVLEEQSTPEDTWTVQPLFENERCSVGIVSSKGTSLSLPRHVHPVSHEYLIVTRGKILLNFDGKAIRIVNEGECASIPKNTPHRSQPLVPDTEVIYICVPQDVNFPTIFNREK